MLETLRKFLVLGAIVIVIATVALGLTISKTLAQDHTGDAASAPGGATGSVEKNTLAEQGRTFGLAISAAISVGIGSLGAGYAVGKVGSAALGAASEKPEMLGRSLVFVGLAEGIAIYGLLIAILLYTKI